MSEELKEAKNVMPASTACLFEHIRENPLLSPFILIGRTALSLHIGHRISEDLDFITLLPKLPRAALKELERELKRDGHEITQQIDPDAYEDFQMSGLELADSQQNWIVDDVVKLTFFSAEPEHERLMAQNQSERKAESGFNIDPLEELSRLKAPVTASRSKSRDWLDLFILERDHQFGVARW